LPGPFFTPTTTLTKPGTAGDTWVVSGHDAVPLPPQRVGRERMAEDARLAKRPRHTTFPRLLRNRVGDRRVERIEADMTKSHAAVGAEADLLIAELEQEFDLLRLRDLKAALDREDERLAEEERLSRERPRPADAAADQPSVVPADGGVEKGAWWRMLAGRVTLWSRVLWVRIRRGTLVEEWRRLSFLERDLEFAMRERRLRTPR
jgi:hypothetical protein